MTDTAKLVAEWKAAKRYGDWDRIGETGDALAVALEAAEAALVSEAGDRCRAEQGWADEARRAEAAEAQRDTLAAALDWIEAEPEDPVKVQLWARAALAAVEPPEEQEHA